MAEIKIKKKAPIWPWIVGAFIVGILIYLLVFANDDDDVDDVTVDDTEQVIVTDTIPAATEYEGINEVNDYNTFMGDQSMDVSHEYSSTALTKLIAATKATATELNVDVNAHLSKA